MTSCWHHNDRHMGAFVCPCVHHFTSTISTFIYNTVLPQPAGTRRLRLRRQRSKRRHHSQRRRTNRTAVLLLLSPAYWWSPDQPSSAAATPLWSSVNFQSLPFLLCVCLWGGGASRADNAYFLKQKTKKKFLKSLQRNHGNSCCDGIGCSPSEGSAWAPGSQRPALSFPSSGRGQTNGRYCSFSPFFFFFSSLFFPCGFLFWVHSTVNHLLLLVSILLDPFFVKP